MTIVIPLLALALNLLPELFTLLGAHRDLSLGANGLDPQALLDDAPQSPKLILSFPLESLQLLLQMSDLAARLEELVRISLGSGGGGGRGRFRFRVVFLVIRGIPSVARFCLWPINLFDRRKKGGA